MNIMESWQQLRIFIVLYYLISPSTTQNMNQYQQYQMQALNRMNERTEQTAAFMMSRGHRHTDPQYSQYITFDTMQFLNNAVTYREYGAFQAQTPGLYFMSFTVRGNTTGTEVQLRNSRGVIYSTAVTPDDSQVTGNSLVLLRRNETVYLELLNGGIIENTLANGTYNSFMGILMVAENSNTNPTPVNPVQNVGNFVNSFGAIQGSGPFGK